jgi:hypothetical protein
MPQESGSEEGLVNAPKTALLPYPRFTRQQAVLERLHSGLRAAWSRSRPDLNAAWLQLRDEWSWVAIVPSEPDCSTAGLARALAEAGTRLSASPVDCVDANDLDLHGSSRLIAQLEMSAGERGVRSSNHAPPITKTIVALGSPLANPPALSIAVAADGVVLCVRRGSDRIPSVRGTIELVGRSRIVCSVMLD